MTGAAGCSPKKEAGKSAGLTTDTTPLKFSMAVGLTLNTYAAKLSDINQDKWVKEMKKRYNAEITIKMLNNSKLVESMQIMFASGDIPDIVRCFDNYNRPDMAQSVQNGVFMPLDDLLTKNKDSLKNLMAKIPAQAWEEEKYNGKIYGVPNIYLSNTSRRATYIRKDLLDKLGLKAPTTLDETIKVLKAFKDAGVKYPYAGREKWSYTDIFFGSFGVNYTTWGVTKDGQLMPDMIRPEMKEALAFHATLRKEGLMDPEALTTKSNDWMNKIYAGEVGMFDHNGNSLNNFNSGLKKNVPNGEFALVASPAGPDGLKGMYKYSSVFESCYINKNYKDAERFLKFLDKMSADEAEMFRSFGIEGQDYTINNGKIQYTYPTEPIKQDENMFRSNLTIIRDDAYNPLTLPFQPGGNDILNWIQNIASIEGITNYDPGDLKSLRDHPDLKPGNCDLFLQASAKIFYGQASLDSFDDFVKEYMKRGGDEIVKETTEAYKAGRVFTRK
jgi:ABC-type sugar transport system, periplasmic component